MGPRGADGHPDGQGAVPPGRSGDLQSGDVGAAHQQEERGAGEQRPEHGLGRTNQKVGDRHQYDALSRFGSTLLIRRSHDMGHFSRGVVDRHAPAQTTDGVENTQPAKGTDFVTAGVGSSRRTQQGRRWQPDVDVAGKIEVGWHDANNRDERRRSGRIDRGQRAAQNVGIARESTCPQVIADDRRLGLAARFVKRTKRSPKHGADADHLEEGAGDGGHREGLGLLPTGDGERPVDGSKHGHVFERSAARAPVGGFSMCDFDDRQCPAEVLLPRDDQTVLVRQAEWTQQHCVDR